jgi:hypothetical protein
VNLPRRDPVTLEQAVVDCPECGERLAVIESLGDSAEVIYIWHPGKEEEGAPPPPRCHENGITSFQAHSAYFGDRCTGYRTTLVDRYHWPEHHAAEPVPEIADDEEPVLDQLTDEQMALLL